jgi:hypothetical protein
MPDKLTPEQAAKKRELDEGMTAMLDSLPRMLWSFYKQLLCEGFNAAQALCLTNGMLTTVFRPKPEADS